MFGGIGKLKNFMGYNDENEVNDIKNYEKKEPVIDTKVNTETRKCDCCRESEVIITKEEMFKVSEDGQKYPLFKEPILKFSGGEIYEGIAICDKCFADCKTLPQEQYVWIFGKMNSLQNIISDKQESIDKNNKRVEEIRKQADEEIRQINEQSNKLNAEINRLQNNIDLYSQEQLKLEPKLNN